MSPSALLRNYTDINSISNLRLIGRSGTYIDLRLALILVVGALVDALGIRRRVLLLSTSLSLRRWGLAALVWCGHFCLCGI